MIIDPKRDQLDFPSFSEGLSLRLEALNKAVEESHDFPSFSEGLSLRRAVLVLVGVCVAVFPFLFGGTFIEAPFVVMR